MTTAELKEYLGMVVQTEKEVNTQERFSQQLRHQSDVYNGQIENLVHSIEEMERPAEPFHTTVNEQKAKENIAHWKAVLIAGAISCVVTPIVGWNGMLFFTFIFGVTALIGIFTFIPAVLIILSGTSAAIKRDNQIYETALKKYRNQMNKYDTVQKANKNRREQIKQLKTQKQVADVCRQTVENSLVTSRRNLEKMYSYNIVFPKYRNYIMVSSIYEYICAGRCTTLEGHEGAYNILELEIRLDHIITQLDTILKELSAIRANQYMLYSCLQEANHKIDTLLQEEARMADAMQALGTQSYEMNQRLGELQRSSELANYLAECSQRELHYMNRMNYLAGHYDNPYGNYAPV